jgi:glutathione S-transferase
LDPLVKTERFLAMNPMGRIPVLELGEDRFLSDSSIICDYLEHTHPSPQLYPEAPLDRARALWIEEFADTDLVAVCARIFWMYIILPIRTGQPVDSEEVTAFQQEAFPKVFDFLEEMAPADDAIVGEQFGIADIALVAPVRLLDLAGAPLDASIWPKFESYYRRVFDRPSARSIMDEDSAATEVWRTTGSGPT